MYQRILDAIEAEVRERAERGMRWGHRWEWYYDFNADDGSQVKAIDYIEIQFAEDDDLPFWVNSCEETTGEAETLAKFATIEEALRFAAHENVDENVTLDVEADGMSYGDAQTVAAWFVASR